MQVIKKCIVCGKDFKCNNIIQIKMKIYCSSKCTSKMDQQKNKEVYKKLLQLKKELKIWKKSTELHNKLHH